MTRIMHHGKVLPGVIVCMLVVMGLVGGGSLGLDHHESQTKSRASATLQDNQLNYVPTNVAPPSSETNWRVALANTANTRHIRTTGPTSPITTRWKFDTDANTFTPHPVVSNGTVYFGTRYYGGNNDGTVTLYAVDTWTGDQRWTFSPTTTQDNWINALAVFRDTVYVGTWNGKVYALDAANGDTFWSLEVDGEVSGLTVANRVLYVTSKGTATGSEVPDGHVYALDALSGEERWQFTSRGTPAGPFKGPPAVVNGSVYVSERYGRVFALDAQTGVKRWQTRVDDQRDRISLPAVANGLVYVSDNANKDKPNTLYALDTESGTEQWSYQGSGKIRAPPAVVNSTLYLGVKGDGLYRLDAATGTELSHTTQFDRTPVVLSGTAYVGRGRTVYSLNSTSGTERGKFTIDDPDARFGSGMAVLNGSMYLGYEFDERRTRYNEDNTAFYALGTPEFTYTNLSVTSRSIDINESVTVTATVTNNGTGPGAYNTTIVVNDNIADTKTGQLDAGTSTTVRFTLRFSEDGTYTVGIDGLNRTIAVGDVAPPPTSTPTKASTSTPTSTSAQRPTDTAMATGTPTTTTTPGFGISIWILTFVVIVAVIVARRPD